MKPWPVVAGLIAAALLCLAPAQASARGNEWSERRERAFAAAQGSAGSVSLAAAQKRLRPGEGLLVIAARGDDIDLFAVSDGRTAWVRLAGRRADVDRRVGALLCQVDDRNCAADQGEVAAAFDIDGAHALYRELVAPVEDALPGVRRLFLASSGKVAALPLALLATAPAARGEAPSWLGDRYAFTTLPAVADLRARKVAAGPGSRVAFVGYGDPVLNSADALQQAGPRTPSALRGALAPLPAAAGELRAMAHALAAPATSLRLGGEATETALKAAPDLARAEVVAFATHGLLAGELRGVDEPALVLTPPMTATAQDDGLLTASEAAGLTLSAEWVILSACNTASPDKATGADSLSPLARAFLSAGARALLASHWRVFDEAAAALTVETLAVRRADPRLTKAEALQRAMRTVRTGRRADGAALPGWNAAWSHPAYWAPFVLIGDGA